MGRFALRWILLVVSLVLSAMATSALGLRFHADTSSAGSVAQLFVGAAVLTFLNATLGNLLKLLTLPLNCLTLGLFSLVINAAMLSIVAQMGLGFHIDGFLAALVGSVLLSAFNGLLGGLLVKDIDD
jgi:putative membrane protein